MALTVFEDHEINEQREHSELGLIAGSGVEEVVNIAPKGCLHENDEAARKKHGWMVTWNRKEANQLPNVRCMDSSDEQPPVEKTVEVKFSGKRQVTFKSRR